MSEDQGPPNDFRSRLSHIPRIDEAPLDQPWLAQPLTRPLDENPTTNTAPPIVRPLEPVAERTTRWSQDPSPQPTQLTPQPAPQLPVEDFQELRRRRRRWPWVLMTLIVIAAVLIGIPAYRAWRTFESIERVPVSDSFAVSSSGRNVLVVGTDSRAGIDANTENAGNILGEGITGERSDTIMILHIGNDGSQRTMSLPRDLWLPINGGDPQRINTAIAQGPDALVTTIQDELGIPITSYVEVDLAGFIEVVDAVGGVTISIPYPAFDRASGLDLPVAGDVKLDSTQALAYVRSRRYTEVIDGSERADPTSDLGRVKRQQTFLRALLSEVTAERNPLALTSVMGPIGDAVRIDDAASFADVVRLALDLRGGLPESVELPTRSASIGGRSVLELAAGADQVIAGFIA